MSTFDGSNGIALPSTATATATVFVTVTSPSPQPTPLPSISTNSSAISIITSTATILQPFYQAEYPSSQIGTIEHPNKDQITTIWVGAVMFFIILLCWNMIILRSILYPWKMLINLVHEASHVFVAIFTGANVYSITIDPDKGPISGMTGGSPFAILSAGYLGSSLAGSGLILASFDTRASKIACLIIAPTFILSFWFGRMWARIRVLFAIGLTIGFWFIDHAFYLRFYILFLGVMNAFYVVWDAMDDLFFRKENESDAALFARMSAPTIHAWVLLWLFISLSFVTLAIIGGLHFFGEPAEVQRLLQDHFLPT